MAHILVVDDEMGIRELLSEILDDEGHEVLLAENASAARAQYSSHELDLVLLDIWMPDTDGMSLLREWNTPTDAAPLGLKCPVIMMSGHASIDAALEAQELGAVGFLEKPITLHKLLSEVHKALSRSKHKPSEPTSSAIEHSLDDANAVPSVATNTELSGTAGIHAAPHFSSVIAAAQVMVQGQQTAPVALSNSNINSAQAAIAASSTDVSTLQSESSITQFAEPVGPTLASLSQWHQSLAQATLNTGLREFREEVERVYFGYLLDQEGWSMTRVAERAGLERTHLYRKLKQLNIDFSRKGKS